MWLQFIGVQCCNCGIHFGLESSHHALLKRDGEWFHCPNGHKQRYSGNTEKEQLRRERDQLRQRLAQVDDRNRELRDARDAAERRVAAAKGQITKLKKRASAGTCPCCNRTFQQLAAHMKQKHPDFGPKVVDLDAARGRA
jgi:hypothetical protein